MRGVEAPDDMAKSYVAKGTAAADANGGPVAIDEDGLPLVYDKAAIQAFWANQGGALQKRWGEFIGLSVPFLTRVATLSITGGAEELSRNDRSLARDARIIIEKLGPTYIKAGQMMSVRPDVLPQAALDELAILQDAVKPFETSVAIDTIERELGGPRRLLRRNLRATRRRGEFGAGVPRAAGGHGHVRRGEGAARRS